MITSLKGSLNQIYQYDYLTTGDVYIYSQQHTICMTHIQQPDQRCRKCDSAQQIFVSLECEHSFCLVCMSYVMIKSRTQKINDGSVACPICDKVTQLDSQSIEAIQQTIENILVPNLNFSIQELSTENRDRLDSLQQLDKYHSVSQKKCSGQTHAPSGTTPLQKHSIKISKRFSEEASYDHLSPTANKYFFSKHMTPKSRDSVLIRQCCNSHPLQQITSVCLSCQYELLCIKCLVTTKHKGHNVKTLSKGVQFLEQQINFKRLQINDRLQHLELSQRRMRDRLEILKQRLFKSQENITQSFQHLIIQVKRKQIELQEECLEVYHSFQEIINKQLQNLNQQISKIQESKEQVQNLLNLDKPFDFLKNYADIVTSMDNDPEDYKYTKKVEFHSNDFLQISENSLVQLFEKINSLSFDDRKVETDKFSYMSTKRRPNAFTSCCTSKQKKKAILKTEESVKNFGKKSLNTLKTEIKNFPECMSSMFQKQLVSKSVFNTERSMDQSKNSTYCKNSMSKILSKRNLLQEEKKIKGFERERQKQKTQRKVQNKQGSKGNKLVAVKRKRAINI